MIFRLEGRYGLPMLFFFQNALFHLLETRTECFTCGGIERKGETNRRSALQTNTAFVPNEYISIQAVLFQECDSRKAFLCNNTSPKQNTLDCTMKK